MHIEKCGSGEALLLCWAVNLFQSCLYKVPTGAPLHRTCSLHVKSNWNLTEIVQKPVLGKCIGVYGTKWQN